MTTVLITAFEPYGEWEENASWLALVELTRNTPETLNLTTRRYPVDFEQVRSRLARDLEDNYDYAIHLGQAPDSTHIALEAIGLNVGQSGEAHSKAALTLCEDGPTAYRSSLPLEIFSQRLASEQIPARVSYHAGTYLCNATLYWTHYFAHRMSLKTQALFVHMPLETSQVIGAPKQIASMPAAMSASAIRIILSELASEHAT